MARQARQCRLNLAVKKKNVLDTIIITALIAALFARLAKYAVLSVAKPKNFAGVSALIKAGIGLSQPSPGLSLIPTGRSGKWLFRALIQARFWAVKDMII